MMGKGNKKKKKLEKMRSAARQQVGKLYIIAACLALLVCGGGHPKRNKVKKQGKRSNSY
ncbi:unnamed protein product [Urochloa decumbens]|uniref:Uncharacterized protein n=1 Tax=Urochloa decumbens TaxID=240449 RepID=A0ABC9GH93_9POAL